MATWQVLNFIFVIPGRKSENPCLEKERHFEKTSEFWDWSLNFSLINEVSEMGFERVNEGAIRSWKCQSCLSRFVSLVISNFSKNLLSAIWHGSWGINIIIYHGASLRDYYIEWFQNPNKSSQGGAHIILFLSEKIL